MESLFFTVLNMSITASIVIAVVLILRLLFSKKMPKWLNFAIWGIVLLRLLVPFSIPSPVSIFNVVPQSQETMSTAEVGERVNRMEFVYQPFTQQHPQAEEASQNDASVPQQGQASPDRQPASVSWSEIVAGVWLAGVVLLLALSGLFYVRVKRQLKTATVIRNHPVLNECIRTVGIRRPVKIYQSPMFSTPVVSGIWRPKIILPAYFDIRDEEVLYHVMIHELVHIKRWDMLTKMISMIAVCIHWFNPLVWLAFYLSDKDMESACDERVLTFSSMDIRGDYARSLLTVAIRQQRLPISSGLVAFGESNVKTRVKAIMKYHRTTSVVVAAAVVVVIAVGCTLLSNAVPQQTEDTNISESQAPPSITSQPQQSEQSGESAPVTTDPAPAETEPDITNTPEEMDYSDYLKEYVLYLDFNGNMAPFSSPTEISPDDYFLYAIGKNYNIFIGKRSMAEAYGEEFAPIERPESYYDENYGYVYPQEEIEDTVREHFDVPVEYMRTAMSYLPEREGYAFPAGPGFGIDTEPIVTGVEQQNDLLFITYKVMTVPWETVDGDGIVTQHPAEYIMTKRLTVQLTEDGFQYISLEEAEPDVESIATVLVQNYISRYEVVCGGAPFADGSTVDIRYAYNYAIDKLLANGAAKEYAVYTDEVRPSGSQVWSYCEIPAERVYEIANEEFGIPAEAWNAVDYAEYDESQDAFNIGRSQPLDTDGTFLLEDAKDLGDDLVEVTVARKSKDKVVSRNIYTFQVSTDSVAENAYLSNYTITGQFVSCRPASA